MGTYTFIVSNLDENPENDYSNALVIDVKGASTQSGAALDSYPRKPNCYDNQLWENVQGPSTGTGGYWYFLKSKSTGYVITANNQSVEVSTQKSGNSDDQLWEFSYVKTDSFGVEWYYIQSKQNSNAISVKGSSLKAGTPLELAAANGGNNQLWMWQGP